MLMKNTPHPGEVLNSFLKKNKLSIAKAAAEIGLSRQTLSSIVNGKSSINAHTAIRLANAFKTSEMFWMNLQARHELSLAIQEDAR